MRLPSAVLLLIILALAAACTDGERTTAAPLPGSGAARTSPAAAPAAPSAPTSQAGLPAPDEPIPERPRDLAHALDRTMTGLSASVDRWLDGPHGAYPPDDLELEALYLQRVTRLLATRPGLEDRVVALLPRRFALEVRADAGASRALFAHANPVRHPSRILTQRPLPPATLLSFYREAQRRFGIAWEVLAAVNFVESKFGRVRSSSSAGAQGPMQFIPSTWAAYGLGGDVNDPHDAILGAANYLHAAGAPSDCRAALYAYNPIRDYVDAVLAYARQMERDPRSLYVYYEFQVFVFTKTGEIRLTGPGL